MNRIFGFKHRYPKSFLEDLAKSLGIKWAKVEFKTYKKEDIPICPLGPPNNLLHYIDYKYIIQ